ncbi:hypothetical protein ACHAXR_010498 [Thalassiosira sp. AJA248-18]
MASLPLLFLCLGILCNAVDGFLVAPSTTPPTIITTSGSTHHLPVITSPLYANKYDDAEIIEEDKDEQPQNTEIAVTINTTLTDTKVKNLFAWIKRAFTYDENDKDDVYAYYYNNIELAIAASFGDNLPENSMPVKLMDMALKKEGLLLEEDEGGEMQTVSDKEWEETLVGDKISRRDRESASLGAMGAAQWSGQWMTRPHSLLDVRNFTSVDDWIKTLPRGCKRTLKKAIPDSQNFTITAKPIRGGNRAPHSSYTHFRCVVHHEVRLLSNMYGASTNAFFNALAEAISRYMGTTRMAGSIREYRDTSTDKVIGLAHEVTKGRTMRGQWFYCDDDAAKRYVWFHSVRDLVKRAIEDERIDVVDLGPSGSDAFTELKQKYGFESVVDWPAVADYNGDFIYEDNQNENDMGDDMMRMIEQLMREQR